MHAKRVVRNAMKPDEYTQRLVRLHCDWLRRTGATEVTQHYRRGVLRRLADALPCPLLEATTTDLDEWQSGLDVSLSTIAGYTSNVRRFYQWAVEAGHIDIDPSARLPLPRVPERKPRPVPDADLATALLCAPEPIRTWLVLAAFLGLRAMEVAGMRREHITEIDNRLYLDGVGKGRKAFRLPVPPEVAEAIRPHLSGQPGPLWRTAPGGRASRPKDVSAQTIKFFRAIGMPYTLHRVRHSFGTTFYAQTRDLLLTQQVMRHNSPTTTRLYVETTSAEATKQMDRLASRLTSRSRRRQRPTTPPPAEDAA